jgi:YVTN family beta-propeller protein
MILPVVRALPVALALLVLALAPPAQGARRRAPIPDLHEAVGFQTFASPQWNPVALHPNGKWVFVANTTSNTVSVLATSIFFEQRQVEVGLEPGSLAVRPDGTELWVSNHVSDSVSVIDIDEGSATFLQVVETIQQIDARGATLFDEPVGIAFANNAKAYVALSSTDRIAIIDTASYAVTGHIDVRAQDPRAIAVQGNRLYVAPFESTNGTEVSACTNGGTTIGGQCTIGIVDVLNFVTEPNIPGVVKNIVVDPQLAAADRDLFVYDTTTDQEVETVSTISTLLYGMAVDSAGRVFLSHTDGRNQENGDHGDVLQSLDNRMFDNELSRTDCGGSCGSPNVVNLEPGGTTHADSLATPYGLALSGDETLLLMTAAGSHRLASFDASLAGGPLDILDVGAMPKGVAFASSGRGGTAYVLNTLDNTVSKILVASDGTLTHQQTVTVGSDPTPDAVRRGNLAFNDAFASATGNFSCGSCHPDGNTDQLLWRIGGNCEPMGCDPGDEPRTTMPIRGLKNTLPLHWDGVLGDPFGGGSGELGFIPFGNPGAEAPDCDPTDADGDHDCFLDLVNGALSGVMCDQTGACPSGGNQNAQQVDAQSRDDMAVFLASVSYPPARKRVLSDAVSRSSDGLTIEGYSASALQGFSDFFMEQGGNGGQPRTCADADGGCHALPLGTDTNSSTLNGFDSPTMRGLNDRFLQFSLGITAAEEIMLFATQQIPGVVAAIEPEIAWDPVRGYEELTTFGGAFGIFEVVYGVRPFNIFQMIEEASTGHAGATGRQVTLNTSTANAAGTVALMSELEAADARGVVNLRAHGRRGNQNAVVFTFRDTGLYESERLGVQLTPQELRDEAATGATLVTLTAALRENFGSAPQPLLATFGSVGNGAIDDPPLPHVTGGASNPSPLSVRGVDVDPAGTVFIDGAETTGVIGCEDGLGGDGFCIDGHVTIDLATRPANGTHLLQVQNPAGPLSNELPTCWGSSSGCVQE